MGQLQDVGGVYSNHAHSSRVLGCMLGEIQIELTPIGRATMTNQSRLPIQSVLG